MQSNQRLTTLQSPLPIILIASVVQGWALFALHQSIKQNAWPATDSAWLLALCALAVAVPLTIQLLSEHARSRFMWITVGIIGVAYFYFGYHLGGSVRQDGSVRLFDADDFVPTAFTMGLLWLLIMPFVQVRLATGGFPYKSLFTTAWRNKLSLAEAALFTGLFWLLLALWQTLFNMLGIGFFKELFQEPIFAYPVTTIVFGTALHLIGSVEKVTDAILEQLLNVLKWLAIVAGFILALFTAALIFRVPELVSSGQKFISAAWLLWLVAVIVLLLNAAYRDGTVVKPYPAWIAFALRCIIPLTVIISATALYALAIRASHYGLTVERVWAIIVASTALLYSVGYSFAAIGKGKWLDRIAPVNVSIAVALIVTIALTLTPVLSPHRLAANSQYRAVLAATTAALANAAESARTVYGSANDGSSSFRYLRFQSGKYGQERLKELSTLQSHPKAEQIRAASLQVLTMKTQWEQFHLDANEVINKLVLFPANREIDSSLRAQLAIAIGKWGDRDFVQENDVMVGGIFIDLNADSVDDFVLFNEDGGVVFQKQDNGWRTAGHLSADYAKDRNLKSQLENVMKGNVSSKASEWRNLRVGGYEYRMNPER